MLKKRNLLLRTTAIGAIALASSSALAQSGVIEEVVVTGSYIRGTPEDAALPVTVISADDLNRMGSPTTLEFLKSLNVSHGVLGETNQFDARAQGTYGAGSVNLRGLGSTRTLVLLNGRRMVSNPFSGAADTNLLPMAAVGRIEILKDGAAATYGSDAIGGVVNFITRSNLEGLDVGGDFRMIDGADGDWTARIAYGWHSDRHSLLLSGGFQHRSELPLVKRDWAMPGRNVSPESGWSAAGNPAGFVVLGSTFSPIGLGLDPGCQLLGGEVTHAATGMPLCNWQYTPYDNLVEKEERFQLFGDYRFMLTDSIDFFVEALYAETDTPQWATSPSYAALQSPTGPIPGFYYVPASHPGWLNLRAQDSSVPATPVGVLFASPAFRPMALGGNPLFASGASISPTTFEAFRVSSGLSGMFGNGIAWDASVTYMEQEGERRGRDTVVSRYQAALLGMGGPDCAGAPGSPGCYYFNPFSNAIERNPVTGTTNPLYDPAVANRLDVIEWFFPEVYTRTTTDILVLDAVATGDLNVTLPGGQIAWAAGAQYREEGLKTRTSDLTNLALYPCVDSTGTGDGSCNVDSPTGPLMFLGGTREVDLSRDVYGVFAEINLPVLDTLEFTLAARFEDYGGRTGNTFDPKLSFRWQAIPELAFRGSVGTTFRGPPVSIIQPDGRGTNLQNILGTFRAVDTVQNPDLKPESATTFNLGTIVRVENFEATVDYWRFDFDNPLGVEPVAGLVNALYPTGTAAGNRCDDPAYAAIRDRFQFGSGGCAGGDITRVERNWINGPGEQTSGIDLSVRYFWPYLLGGEIATGLSATYVIEYQVDAQFIEGIQVSESRDAVGFLNYGTTAYPLPEWKADFFVEYTTGGHNVRWVTNYVDSYVDQRAPFAVNPTLGAKISSYTTHDLHYRVELPTGRAQTTLSLSVNNLADRKPPFARLELAYDPFTHSALGRNVKLGLTTHF